MTLLRSAFPAMLRNGLATMVQYRGEVTLWAVWGVVYPAVMLSVWSAAGAGQGGISGYDYAALAGYFLAQMVVGHFTTAWDLYEMGYLVKSGTLSARLLRPLLPIWRNVADNLAYKIVTLVILIPVWSIVFWIVQPRLSLSALHIVGGCVALLLGGAICFLWGYIVALIAFWTTRTDAVAETWFGASLLFGGRIGPIAALPGPLHWVAVILPFRWMTAFPAEVLIGRVDAAGLATGLSWQLAWLAAGVLVFRWAWPRALRQYSAVGA